MTTATEQPTNGHVNGVADGAWGDIKAVLAQGEPKTALEIAEAAGRHNVTVYETLKKHKKEVKAAGFKDRAQLFTLKGGVKGKSNIEKSKEAADTVFDHVKDAGKPISAADIRAKMPKVNQSTVYHALKKLTDAERIEVVGHEGGCRLYALKKNGKSNGKKAPTKVKAGKAEELLEVAKVIVKLEAELASARARFAELAK